MVDAVAKRDTNRIPVTLVVGDDADKTIYHLTVNALTGKLLVESSSADLTSTLTIYNKTMTLANTEYSQALPAGTKFADIKLRGQAALLKLAFAVGESGTNYITIPYGASIRLDAIDLTGVTVYMQSPTAGQVVEILCGT